MDGWMEDGMKQQQNLAKIVHERDSRAGSLTHDKGFPVSTAATHQKVTETETFLQVFKPFEFSQFRRSSVLLTLSIQRAV